MRVVGFLPTGFRFSSGYFSVIFRLSLTAFRLPKTNRLLRWISIRLAACEVSSGHLSLGCFLWYTRVPIPKMIHLCTNLSNHPTRLIFFRLFHAFHVSKSPVEQRLVSEALHPLPNVSRSRLSAHHQITRSMLVSPQHPHTTARFHHSAASPVPTFADIQRHMTRI